MITYFNNIIKNNFNIFLIDILLFNLIIVKVILYIFFEPTLKIFDTIVATRFYMIGGDVIISEMRMKHTHNSPSTLLYYRVDQPTTSSNLIFKSNREELAGKKKSFFQILNILIKFSIATDPFLIGNIFKCGYMWNIILFLVFTGFTEFSFFILFESWIYGRAYAYNEIWRELFGPSSPSWIILVLVIINYLTLIVWAQNELYYYVSETVSLLWEDAPSILTNQWFLTYVLTAVLICPSFFVKKLSNFATLSMVSNFCLIIGLVCLIFYFFHYLILNDISFATTAEENELKMFKNDVFNIFHTIQSLTLAIFCHPALSILVADLDNPTRSRLMKLTWIASITSLVVHFFGAFFSYLINPENDDNIFYEMELYNENGSKIIFPEVIIGQIAVYIVSVCSNIVYVHFTAIKVSEIFMPKGTHSTVSIFFCGLTITLFASAMNFIGDEAVDICDLIGGITCVLLTYVFPSLYYFCQYKFSRKVYGISSIIFIVFGCILAIAFLVIGIIEYNED